MPRKKEPEQLLTELGDATVRLLLDVIQNGVPVLDQDGKPVIDEDGKPVTKPAPAAYVGKAIDLLRHHGIKLPTAAPHDDPFTAIRELERLRQGRVPTGEDGIDDIAGRITA